MALVHVLTIDHSCTCPEPRYDAVTVGGERYDEFCCGCGQPSKADRQRIIRRDWPAEQAPPGYRFSVDFDHGNVSIEPDGEDAMLWWYGEPPNGTIPDDRAAEHAHAVRHAKWLFEQRLQAEVNRHRAAQQVWMASKIKSISLRSKPFERTLSSAELVAAPMVRAEGPPSGYTFKLEHDAILRYVVVLPSVGRFPDGDRSRLYYAASHRSEYVDVHAANTDRLRWGGHDAARRWAAGMLGEEAQPLRDVGRPSRAPWITQAELDAHQFRNGQTPAAEVAPNELLSKSEIYRLMKACNTAFETARKAIAQFASVLPQGFKVSHDGPHLRVRSEKPRSDERTRVLADALAGVGVGVSSPGSVPFGDAKAYIDALMGPFERTFIGVDYARDFIRPETRYDSPPCAGFKRFTTVPLEELDGKSEPGQLVSLRSRDYGPRLMTSEAFAKTADINEVPSVSELVAAAYAGMTSWEGFKLYDSSPDVRRYIYSNEGPKSMEDIGSEPDDRSAPPEPPSPRSAWDREDR